ncbi:transcriptional regulator, IclR family [Saccharopolyspora kobensis]|uniref:Transcriptional regulator, IclR family n=1 Tax=Saccharopolyspora kobensis TaxID=146035 RepID=A0A1H6E712_9PSEU|nr:IclR family transcriptional regulator [Saccharopolyspora kobensis]SEG93447.1 transcriptional regulator, IclR family [Saccharopolyspora kobensis]SFD45368.1 transcriptional regulator, IclR family [Saccharopolyspora kobensis]
MSKTVAKAVHVLESLAEAPKTIAELARELDVHSSSALRMVQPLADGGLIARGPDNRYRLGLRLVELGQQVLDEMDLRVLARPHLIALADATRATVHLAQLVDDQIVYVDKIEGAATIRTWSRIGRAVPLHTAAASKVILAALPAPHCDRLLAAHTFTRFTERTITDPAEFREHLATVARLGYATDQAEFEPLVHCIGVAIPDATGQLGAAISLTTVRASVEQPVPDKPLHRMREAANAIATALGRPLR